MEKRTGMLGFVAVTVLLVLIAALFVGETVMSRTGIAARDMEEFYLAKEKKLTEEVRELLALKGFENSGVMVTRVVEADGNRLYTVTVHHAGIDYMDDEDRELLLSQLEALSFDDEKCSFSHRFLLNK